MNEIQDRMTPYIEGLLTQQREAARCVRDTFQSIGSALWKVVGGAVVAAVGLVIFGLLGKESRFFIIMVLSGLVALPALLVVYGLYRLFTLLMKLLLQGKKRVACPSCGTRYRMYDEVYLYLCTSCGLPLHLEFALNGLQEKTCPECQHSFGIATNWSNHRCNNCGIELTNSGAVASTANEERHCESCGVALPMGAFCCSKCHEISIPAPATLLDSSLDAKLSRGKLGTALHTRAILTHYLDELATSGLKASTPILNPFDVIGGAIATCVNADLLADKELAPHIVTCEVAIDKLYAIVLMKAYNFMSDNPDATYPEGTVKKYNSLAPRMGRRIIRSAMAKANPETSSSCAPADTSWARELFAASDYTSVQKNNKWVDIVKNPSPLREEAIRIWPAVETFGADVAGNHFSGERREQGERA